LEFRGPRGENQARREHVTLPHPARRRHLVFHSSQNTVAGKITEEGVRKLSREDLFQEKPGESGKEQKWRILKRGLEIQGKWKKAARIFRRRVGGEKIRGIKSQTRRKETERQVQRRRLVRDRDTFTRKTVGDIELFREGQGGAYRVQMI